MSRRRAGAGTGGQAWEDAGGRRAREGVGGWARDAGGRHAGAGAGDWVRVSACGGGRRGLGAGRRGSTGAWGRAPGVGARGRAPGAGYGTPSAGRRGRARARAQDRGLVWAGTGGRVRDVERWGWVRDAERRVPGASEGAGAGTGLAAETLGARAA
ncbi:glycine-rich cell wall structural protein 1.0-like [Miscanthus floridulus]|uniref:glycine-rich cell wall structural protein 1.0-like n=1 Tax=Miscanthus floridulus TaxID=154761 RepID=UPI00345AFB8E